LPGCKAHGPTRQQALEAGDEIKELWLQVALEKGADIPEPQPQPTFSGKLGLRLPKSLHARATHAADTEGVSLNTYLVQAITEVVERSGQKNLMRYIEGMLSKGLRSLLPAAIGGLVRVKVDVEHTFGEESDPMAHSEVLTLPKQKPVILDEQEQAQQHS
jgi:hypothetical protein